MRIVLIEDNRMLARAVIQALEQDGHSVDWLADGLEGSSFLTGQGADLAIVDLNLPGRGGLDVIRDLIASGGTIPVLVLTARDGLEDRIAGLDAGADDYLTKPFELAELCARVRALGRRRGQKIQTIEKIGGLSYDRLGRMLTGPDGPVELSRREMALWDVLFDNAERVVSKATICDSVYGTGADVEINAVELLVSRLRRRLEGAGISIRAIRGLGYIMQQKDQG
ncbi:MAG: response regulator transcription factor [Paracoccus sp. (in: a-proteobacteria)]|nr:response regulator transcription factor [Paracoccus sp. (in: a-proteobacteria)]